jgi:glycosyltransferase involved in cell wall biosynthesis
MTGRPSLIVFSDDWGRHPSSCQHLVSHLIDDFHVTWVNTIGTRPPRLDNATIGRAYGKLRHWMKKSHNDESVPRRGPHVLSPIMWPSFHWAWQRRLNRSLILKCLRKNVADLDTSIILTTIPIVADLINDLPAARWVYYCVDDFAKWPGLDGKTLERMESALIAGVNTVVAAGDNLAERIRHHGRDPIVITHGVDVDYWRSKHQPCIPLPLQSLERPLVLFWGLIDQRLDVEWLRALGGSMSSGSIVLIGPQQSPDSALVDVNRLHLTGPIAYEQLPGFAAAADVLIMPYADLPVTRAMQPLKLKEYLATGKPVVVRRLPSVIPWEDHLSAVCTAEAFVSAVLGQLETDHHTTVYRNGSNYLQNERWSCKASDLRRVLIGN